ncbi:hypothetical protein [Paludibaculum fermentans]|uniref:hypothetical protein n=1 Tax=Paludibaculum fermentans TaxID=1473598 RepID=UPI003EB92A88
MRRRDLFALPAAALLPAPAALPAKRPRKTVKLLLDQADPYAQLEHLWHFGVPAKVFVRAHPAWWPSALELPDRWQAWVETRDGVTVLISCLPREGTVTPSAGRTGRVSSLIASSLRTA